MRIWLWFENFYLLMFREIKSRVIINVKFDLKVSLINYFLFIIRFRRCDKFFLGICVSFYLNRLLNKYVFFCFFKKYY